MTTAKILPLGPIMLDIEGTHLTKADCARLLHPLVGGIILFSRNFQSIEQLRSLTQRIHALRSPTLLIAVDHEGGRVQRFREGFTALPPMRVLGELYDESPQAATLLAQQIGYVLAAELRACGIDFSFTPVLDVDFGRASVIGNRAFHANPEIIGTLAYHLQQGLKQAGMASVGKHFPGHGYVTEDSHLAIPVDERTRDAIFAEDIIPFQHLIQNRLTAIMPAHVIYPAVDSLPAGFSKIWLSKILRQQLGFEGVIFSDDLGMEGASVAGTMLQRAALALRAGCDMILICNKPQEAGQVLSELRWTASPLGLTRLARMHGHPHALTFDKLQHHAAYQQAVHAIHHLAVESHELPFNGATP